MEKDILSSLEPYYKDSFTVNDIDKVGILHAIFVKDFFEEGVMLDDEKLVVKPYKYNRSKKDDLPQEYEKFNEKFVHIITREVKATRWKTAPKVREFRLERANRIHWIKPIIENCNDKRITRFKHMENDGRIREYFWYRDKQYIVVVEHINPNYALITGFCIDSENREYFQKKYINREK